MKALFFLLILLLAIADGIPASEAGFVAGGTLTRLDAYTYRAHIWGYVSEFQIGGAGPYLLPDYPYAVNLDDWSIYGSFSPIDVVTPFPWEAGAGWIHVGPYHSPWEGISELTFDFYQQSTPELLLLRVETLGHVWYDLGMDNWIALDNLTGHTRLAADVPTTIGASTEFSVTPEPGTLVLFALGLATMAWTGWRRHTSRPG